MSLKIWVRKILSRKSFRSRENPPRTDKLIAELREDDIVVIWKLDCLGRSLQILVDLVNIFHEKKVGLQSLQDAIDTSTTQGKFTFDIGIETGTPYKIVADLEDDYYYIT